MFRQTPTMAFTRCARWRIFRSAVPRSRSIRTWSRRWPRSSWPQRRANRELGLLDATRADAIVAACRGSAGGPAARAVRGRRHPGRRRHLDQHERQRGDRQSRAGTAGPAEGRLPVPASQRARQHEPEHQRRLSDGAQARGAIPASCGWSTRWRVLREAFEAQGRRVQGHPQDGPHPAAGRGADDARAGVLAPMR